MIQDILFECNYCYESKSCTFYKTKKDGFCIWQGSNNGVHTCGNEDNQKEYLKDLVRDF